MKRRYRPAALAQLDKIFAYIQERDPKAAQRVIERIKRSIQALSDFPYGFRQSAIPGIRELPIIRYPYIVFYTIDETAEEVLILRVRHTARDPQRNHN